MTEMDGSADDDADETGPGGGGEVEDVSAGVPGLVLRVLNSVLMAGIESDAEAWRHAELVLGLIDKAAGGWVIFTSVT